MTDRATLAALANANIVAVALFDSNGNPFAGGVGGITMTINPTGNYNGATAYAPGDLFFSGGVAYLAIAAAPAGTAVTDTGHFKPIGTAPGFTSVQTVDFPQNGDVLYRRIRDTHALLGIRANGKAGSSCDVALVTAAEFAAAPYAAAGTALGTVTVTVDGTPSATVLSGQALAADAWLRYNPNNPAAPMTVYESA